MADDTRKKSSQEGEEFKAVPHDPNQEEHTRPRVFVHRPAETKEEEDAARKNASVSEAIKTIKGEDFTTIAQKPCVRNAFLPGIGGGVAIGAARFILGAPVISACNWASGGFVGISMAMYQVCQHRRRKEKDNIRQAVKVLDEKQAIKDAKTGQPIQAGGYKPPGQAGTQNTTSDSQLSARERPKEGVSFWQSFKFW